MPAIPKPETAQQARARRKRDAAQLLARVRELVTARDRVCRLCGDAWPLEVHHIKFRSAGGAPSPQPRTACSSADGVTAMPPIPPAMTSSRLIPSSGPMGR